MHVIAVLGENSVSFLISKICVVFLQGASVGVGDIKMFMYFCYSLSRRESSLCH